MAGSDALRVDVSAPDAHTVVVTPTGVADPLTVPILRQALAQATGTGRSHVVVDLDRLSFLDASTLGALVVARRRISAAGGRLQVKCHSRHGRRLLFVTRLDDMLDDRP